jgi:nucleoside-diphosphate-sugar epimerase
MRVFVTGATGYVGAAIVAALVRAGHEVSGMSRSPERDDVVRRLGATPVRGTLGAVAAVPDLAGHEALVHAAVDYGLGPPADEEAIDALVAAARAARRPVTVVYTSGVWVLGETPTPATESAPTDHPAAAVAWRPRHERKVLDAAAGEVVTAVVRPGIVYGEKRGLVSPWFADAARGVAPRVVGPGRNRWPFVHRDDVAELYRLVVERRAGGVFHGVDGASPTVADAARAAGAAAGREGVEVVPIEHARQTVGAMADALAMDQVVVAERARALGWQPRRGPFLAEARAAFREWASR